MGFHVDVRNALRTFRARRGFTAAVLITLALGIGASTAMFSVLNTVLLKPLPQENAPRVVRIYQPNDSSQTTGLSPLEMADFRAQTRDVFANLVEYHTMPFVFVGQRDAQRLQTGVVSASFFDAMGIQPLLGRTFQEGEEQVGSEPVLLLSHAYWQREFNGSPDVIGRTLRMNDRAHTVVGVLPPFPQYPDENDVYMPISSCPFRIAPSWAENRAARGLAAFGLLREDVTPERALANLRSVATQLKEAHPEAYASGVRYDVSAVPLPELVARPARATLVVLLLATLLLLGIVCSNVGNLFVVSTLQRGDELAVRHALGATTPRLARRLLTESALLAAAGGAMGLVVAFVGTKLLAASIGHLTPRASEIALDLNVLLFAFGATAVTAVTAGLLPLAALRRGVAGAVRHGASRNSSSGMQTRLRKGLIVLQVAVSLVLLAGAGLLGRTLLHLQAVDAGFDPARVTSARLDLNWTTYDSQARRNEFYRQLERELAQLPGIEAVGIGSSFPLNSDPANTVRFTVPERSGEEDDSEPPAVAMMTASPRYFDALGAPLQLGRGFTTLDEEPTGEPVYIVTRSLAEEYWGRASDAVGRQASLDGGRTWGSVVGVIGDLRLGLEGDYDHVAFMPHNRLARIEARVLVRSALPAADTEQALRRVVAAIDPEQPITDIRALAAYRGDRLAPYRLTAALMGVFAVVALGVTAFGLGGAIAFAVAQRTREIGIRIAVGARPAKILGMLLTETIVLAAIGCAIGTAAALYGAGYLRQLTPGVEAGDPLTFAGTIGVIVVVATLAGLAPARRALGIDPLRVLNRP